MSQSFNYVCNETIFLSELDPVSKTFHIFRNVDVEGKKGKKLGLFSNIV